MSHISARSDARPLRLYIDLDDVLCETARALADLHLQLHGRTVDFENIHSFELWKSFSLTMDEYDDLMQRGHEDEFLFSVKPVTGCREALGRLKDADVIISIVTGRPPDTSDVSEAWLDANGIAFDDLIFVDKYQRNSPEERNCTPLADLPSLQFSFAIEDAPHMVEHLVDQADIPTIIFDRPWNRHLVTGDAFPFRASCWYEIETLVLNTRPA